MEWYMYILVVLAGLVAGFINTLAGSGSLITLPLLMFLGLPANVANGTNRISILAAKPGGFGRICKTQQLELKTGLLAGHSHRYRICCRGFVCLEAQRPDDEKGHRDPAGGDVFHGAFQARGLA